MTLKGQKQESQKCFMFVSQAPLGANPGIKVHTRRDEIV